MLKINQSMQKTNTCFNAKASDGSWYIEVPTYTLYYLIEKCGPFDVLKMDCEGCEYDIVLHEPETLERFVEIGLEYHKYNTRIPSSRLIERISRFGFSCSRVNDWIYLKNSGPNWNSEMIGTFHCVKKG
jgi:hypothetical protein